MPCADGLCVLLCQLDHGFIGPTPADETFAGGFAERQPELDPWHRADQRFMHIFHGLDEMRLAQDKVNVLRLFDLYGLDVHLAASCCQLLFFKTSVVDRYPHLYPAVFVLLPHYAPSVWVPAGGNLRRKPARIPRRV